MGRLNKIFQIGAFDRRVELHTPTVSTDDYGQDTSSASTSVKVWGWIDWWKGSEGDDSGKENVYADFKIWIRYRSGVSENMFVKYDGEEYDITFIEERGRKRFLGLHCVNRRRQ